MTPRAAPGDRRAVGECVKKCGIGMRAHPDAVSFALSRMYALLAAASFSTACASQSSSIALPPAPVDLNLPATASTYAHFTSRGDIPRAESTRYASMADLLAARVPALDVRPIGTGRFTLRVHGYTSVPNAEPVVVIDGMRYLKNGAEMLASLSPREVRRIEVPKDVASIAAFASAATGGVVVVTTWRH